MRRWGSGLLLVLVTAVTTSCGVGDNSAPVTVLQSTTVPAVSPGQPSAPTLTRTSRVTVTPARPPTKPSPKPPVTTRPSSSPATGTPATATAVSTPSTSTGATPTSCAQGIVDKLTQRQKIGQLIMIGVPIDDPASDLETLSSTPVGGIFLMGRSSVSKQRITSGISQVQDGATKTAGVPLHVSVDQEGGQVQTLGAPDYPTIADAVQQGQETSDTLTSGTTAWAKLLVETGVTLDLAPVADTVPAGTEDNNPPIGRYQRQYGSSPGAVSASIDTVVRAMLGAGLGTTVKHFPGLGRVLANTDTSSHAVDDQTSLDDSYLRPFQKAIDDGTTAVMVSSALYPNLDADNIAAFSSKIITGLLRTQMKFNGLVISDDFGGAVALQGWTPGQRAVKFIRAGGDMVLSVKFSDLAPMTAALTAEASADPAFQNQVDAAVSKVIASKASVNKALLCGSAR